MDFSAKCTLLSVTENNFVPAGKTDSIVFYRASILLDNGTVITVATKKEVFQKPNRQPNTPILGHFLVQTGKASQPRLILDDYETVG